MSQLPPMPSELLLLAKDPLIGPALVEWGRRIIASRSEKQAQEDRALNLLRGLHKVVLDLSDHFEKPITDDNVTRWLALNSAQAAVKEFLDAANR